MAPGYRRADLAFVVFLGSLWGTAFMFISLGLDRFSPLLFAALRFDISGAFLLLLAAGRRMRSPLAVPSGPAAPVAGAAALRLPFVPRGPRAWTAILFAGALMTGSYHGFLFWGQQYTTASVAAVIVGLSPVLTTGFSRALLPGDRLGGGGLAGLAIGLAGVVILASLKGGSPLDARGLGELAVVAAIASWALGSVLVRRVGHGMDILAFAGWQSLVGAALLHATSLALEGTGSAIWDRNGIVALLYLSVISSGLGFIIYFTLLGRVGPIRVNVVSYVAPVFATVAGILVLEDPFEWRALVAFLLIAAGFALVTRPAAPAGAPPAPPAGTRAP